MAVNGRDSAGDFGGRDLPGLLPATKAKSEQQTRTFYFKMVGAFTTFYGPIVATGLYLGISYFFPEQSKLYQTKLQFIREHDMGWLYGAWFVVFLAKTYAVINANGARAPARLDRPDQHIYQVMAESGPLADAPFVLMAKDGPAGRFNRAARAAANLDEGMPVFLSGLLLQGAVFGPLSLGVAALYLVGACKFANGYKEETGGRMGGFLWLAISTQLSGSLVALVAFQTLVRPVLPF